MAQFITRVELHGVRHDEAIYQTLHDAMEANGFKITIKAGNGKTYHMLTAEYEITGNYTANSVLESAKSAADQTGKKYSIFTSEIVMATWWNLTEV